MGSEAISCHEITEGLTEYLEDALSPVRRQGYDAHLDRCAGCRDTLEQLRATIAAMGALPPACPPAEIKRRLVEKLRDLPPS